jgi:hypothetical protein
MSELATALVDGVRKMVEKSPLFTVTGESIVREVVARRKGKMYVD